MANKPTGGLPTDPLAAATSMYASIPYANLDAAEIQKNLDALATSQAALEHRYDNPNWFNVAAGFLKPQLGGFAASLGSAAQALGENVEKQRENIIPVATARAQNAYLQAMQRGKQKAAEAISDYDANPDPDKAKKFLPQLFKTVTRYNDPVAIDAVKNLMEGAQTVAGTKVSEVTAPKIEAETETEKERPAQVRADVAYRELNTAIEAQGESTKNLFFKAPPGTLPDDWTTNVDKTREKIGKALVASGMYTPDGIKSLTDSQLQESFAGLSSAFAEAKMKSSAGVSDVIQHNTKNLDDLAVARVLSTSPKMDKILNLGQGQDALSALFGYIASPTDQNGQASRLAAAAAKLAQTDPQVYADFQVLQKALTTNLADARAAIQNPSVGAQQLLSGTMPQAGVNSALAIPKMLDLIALEKHTQVHEGLLRQRYKGQDISRFEGDPDSGYADLMRHRQDKKVEIGINPTDATRLPTFYNAYGALTAAPTAPAGGQERPAPAGDNRPFHWEYNADRTQRRRVYD